MSRESTSFSLLRNFPPDIRRGVLRSGVVVYYSSEIIMDAFLNIAKEGNATLTTVAPPIAEALVATAIGLVAAIPAVIAYNVFYNKLRSLDTEVDTFSNDFLNIIKRHLG